MLDHSVLKPESTEREIRAGAGLVREWRVGCYCVQPCWVRTSAQALAGSDAVVASVVGFPHGTGRLEIKSREAAHAVDDGAGEIDVVQNIGALRGGDAQYVARDLAAVVRAVPGIPVKVILETAVLTDAEIRLACRLARDAGAAFVKTSTGFHAAGGATAAAVRLMRAEVGAEFGVKASGGIRTLAETLAMIDAGATRIGTSASAEILAACP
ncbi:MAG: deoxyribose-phosphate aldolase [Casimicrobiaceae bacterium]